MVTPAASLTIDELAQRVGMTVRNVRAHQSRGLLPPPEVRGRTGYYTDDHVARLELIKDMQADGFNLRAIRAALDALPAGAGPEALAFRRRVVAPWSDEEPELMDRSALVALMGTGTGDHVAEAARLGIVRVLDEDRVEVPAPSLIRAAAEVVALGVPIEDLLKLQREMNRHVSAVAKAFVRLYVEHVWHPFVTKGQPEEMWPAVRDALDRLQPLAGESLVATFRLAMEQATLDAVGTELATPPKPKGRRRG
ncbi:MAG TPA: MerR family transcriptional regulator [Frankiaceae bacterium]|nr:MerR family transcriptional regulator [Frankiaceae bacterium]